MKKKFLSVLVIVAVLIGMAGVSGTQAESGEQKADKEQKQQENEQTAETKVEIPPEKESIISNFSSSLHHGPYGRLWSRGLKGLYTEWRKG